MKKNRRIGLLLLVAGLSGLLLGSMVGCAQAASDRLNPPAPAVAEHEPSGPSQILGDSYVYLPIVSGAPPWPSPFGVEPVNLLLEGSLYYTRTQELGVGWARLGTHVHWRQLQPNEGDPIQWSLLTAFEDELRDLKKAGVHPLVTITDSPHWATIIPSSCAAVRADKFADFANFMRQLVERYNTDEFNVHDWEIGNEPDVDKYIVSVDSGFGCWGDLNDPYYGGRHYGEMLKAIAPVIRAADPKARIWIGGLLLDRPNTIIPGCTQPGMCRPELFLEGILLSGAASSFDVLAYHTYPHFDASNPGLDQDNGITTNPWYAWGGLFAGKATFLRQTLQAYGVDKPLVVNETSMICRYYGCTPGEVFFQRQADFLARSYVRALANNITGMMWYTLEGPGWYDSGLLSTWDPKLVYRAYQHLTERLRYSRYLAPVSYGADIEAYAFEVRPNQVQVVWAKTDQALTILVPGEKFLVAYSRDGDVLTATPVGSDYQLPVGFSPIYILLNP